MLIWSNGQAFPSWRPLFLVGAHSQTVLIIGNKSLEWGFSKVIGYLKPCLLPFVILFPYKKSRCQKKGLEPRLILKAPSKENITLVFV